MSLFSVTMLLMGLNMMSKCTNNTPHPTTNQAPTTNHLLISISLTMEASGSDTSARSIKLPEAGQSYFSGCHIRVTQEEKMIRTRLTGDKEPFMWAPDKSKKWMEFLEIPVRDGAGNHTRTITIGVVWREKREWDILGNKEDIMICAAYVEDFEIYFLVAVVKPKMTRNVMMTSFQATNFLNLLVACDKKVLDIQENVVRRFAKVTTRACNIANKSGLFLGYSKRVEVFAEGDEVFDWPVIERIERKDKGEKEKGERKREMKEKKDEIIQIDS